MEKGLVHSYKTIAERSEGTITEKRSKFIAHAIPVSSEEEAMLEVEALRKQYYDARHVCWAYRIGRGLEPADRINDDGEPSSTAGKPIHGQIVSRDLTDILVAVIRYFGGVKLGTGGLIVAYRSAASEALEEANIVEHTMYTQYRLRFPFDLINPVMMLLRAYDAETLGNDADTEGHIWDIQVANAQVLAFEEAAEALYQMKIDTIEN